jgi:hypothetical protein
MTMVTQWDNPTMSYHDTKEMKGHTEETKQFGFKNNIGRGNLMD